MGYISYPRSMGSRHFQRVIDQISAEIQLAINAIDPTNLSSILALVSRVGFENLPPEIRELLMQMLYKKLYPALKNLDHLSNAEQQEVQALTHQLNTHIINLGLSIAGDVDLPFHEKLNSTGFFDFTALEKRQTARTKNQVISCSNGMTIVTLADSQRDVSRSLSSDIKSIRSAVNVLDKDGKKLVKEARVNNTISAYNLLSPYLTCDKRNNATQLNLEAISSSCLQNLAVCEAVLHHEGRPCGSYSSLKKLSLPGFEREHPLPQSIFMSHSVPKGGRRGAVPLLAGVGNYSEGKAFAYPVFDGQTKGTEHRIITDLEIAFAQKYQNEGRFPSVNEWLDLVEKATFTMFTVNAVREEGGGMVVRYSAPEAKVMSRAIRNAAEAYVDKFGMDKDMSCSNLICGGDVPDNSQKSHPTGM